MTEERDQKPIIPGSTSAESQLYDRFYIQLQHLPTMKSVYFKALLTQFEDQYTSDWQTEQVFGRMDPIRSFRGTQRIISLGWDVVAASLEEAEYNLGNCSNLLSMLYPSYDQGVQNPISNNGTSNTTNDSANPTPEQEARAKALLESTSAAVANQGNAATIHSAPLFRLKFANLIQSTRTTDPVVDISSGLVGTIDGLTYAPDLEQGFFDPVEGSNKSVLYPQTIKLSFGFYVTHDHPLGWNNQSGKGAALRAGSVFPYPKTKKQ
jgi:hypothetical protein